MQPFTSRDEHHQLLRESVERLLPSDCNNDLDGAKTFVKENHPTLVISRNKKIPTRIVPVFFISFWENNENRNRIYSQLLYELSGHKALLCHRFDGNSLGQCTMVPFVYHVQPSAQLFCTSIEAYLSSSNTDVAWWLTNCHVKIQHGGIEYEPSDEIESLHT